MSEEGIVEKNISGGHFLIEAVGGAGAWSVAENLSGELVGRKQQQRSHREKEKLHLEITLTQTKTWREKTRKKNLI